MDPTRLADTLAGLGFQAAEFIPSRNTFDHLKRYVNVLRSRSFLVTFGTEHNTPALISLVPSARVGVSFDEDLARSSWEGACVLAAHQKRVAEGEAGYVERSVAHTKFSIEALARIGREIIGVA